MCRVGNRRIPCTWGPGLERLECRTVLSWNDFPDATDLLNPDDTVVRLQTNFGDIDFELFDKSAPATVANFLSYVRDGDYDKSFFHGLALDAQTAPVSLHGGGFRLHGPTTSGAFNGGSPGSQAWERVPPGAAMVRIR